MVSRDGDAPGAGSTMRAMQARQLGTHQWLATTLESIGDAVMATDPEGRVTFMNPVAEALTGWARGDALGLPSDEVLRLVDEGGATVPDPVTRALTERTTVRLPRATSLVARSGDSLRVDDSAAPIFDAEGALLGGVIVFRDVTKQVQQEQRLAHIECLASIGTLSAGMAHEINNPLTYVQANIRFSLERLATVCEALGDHSPETAPGARVAETVGRLREMEQMLTEAAEGAERVRQVVEDLKKLTRARTTRTPVDHSDVLESAGAGSPPARSSAPCPPLGPRGRVLVVDDEAFVAQVVARALHAEHDVTVVLDGRSALAKLSADGAYDVIFCDLMMPTMRGIELYRSVLAEHPALAARFVFMTGSVYSPGVEDFLAGTGIAHLDKPLDLPSLRAIARARANDRTTTA